MAFLGIYGCLLEMDNGLRTTYFIALLHTHDHHAPNPLSASFLALAFSAGRFGVGIFFAYLSTVVIRSLFTYSLLFVPPSYQHRSLLIQRCHPSSSSSFVPVLFLLKMNDLTLTVVPGCTYRIYCEGEVVHFQ